MRFSLPLLLPFLPFLTRTHAQSQLECPNADLTAYLLQVIDALYANGLTTFESLLADITGTDAGYHILSTIFAQNGTTTLLVPTDAAFQMAGVWAPFEHQTKDYLVDLVGLHAVQGHWGYNELPETRMGVGKSMMRVDRSRANGTSGTGRKVGWEQNIVMRRGEKGQVVLKTARGDVTSWSGPAHLDAYDLLDNLVILPIDHLLPNPPNISTALTLPTTARSPNGLLLLVSAITKASPTGADALAGFTSGGLTFFAPVDDAWAADAWAQMDDKAIRSLLLGNHYTTNSTVFSPDWMANGAEVTVMTGQKLVLSVEGETSYVSLGSQKAQILRSDIALENGVLHIIDKVFLVSDAAKPAAVLSTEVAPVSKSNDVVKPSVSPSGGAAAVPVKTSAADPPFGTNLAIASAMYWTALVGAMVWYAATSS